MVAVDLGGRRQVRRAPRDLAGSRSEDPRLETPGLLRTHRRRDPLRKHQGHRGRGLLPREGTVVAQETRLPRRPEGRALSIPHEPLPRPELRGPGSSRVAGASGRPYPRPRQTSHALLCLLCQPRTRRAAVRGAGTEGAGRRAAPEAPLLAEPGAAHRQGPSGGSARLQTLRWPAQGRCLLTDTVGIRQTLDHLGLSPPEKPPPDLPEVVRVPVDDEGREIGANPA
jgi:hypothetical protein